MQHRAPLLIGLCISAGCTYEEYNTYNDAPIGANDAGVREGAGQGGGGNVAGTGGDGGSAGSAGLAQAGSAGSAQAGSAGSSGNPPGADCTGCVRLSVLTSRTAELQLEFDSRRNLSSSLVLWRVRVRDYVGDVQLMTYIESGDHVGPELGFTNEGTSSFAQLNAASGWQDLGIDLQPGLPFVAPFFQDAGAFNPGIPFDKSRVERVGLRIVPQSQPGVFTPATIEVDAVTFSTQPSLNVAFSTNADGFELVDPEAATLTHVAE